MLLKKYMDNDNTPIMTIAEAEELLDKYVGRKYQVKLKIKYRMDNKQEKKDVYIRQQDILYKA